MKKKKILAACIAGMLAAGCLCGCGSSAKKEGAASAKLDTTQELNTIMFEPLTFDSTACYDASTSTVLGAVQEGLIRASNDGTKDTLEKAGAESWEVSDDGLEYTFKLRKNKWSDGKDVVAQNYVDAVTRLLDSKNGFKYAFFGFDIKNGQAFYKGEVGKDEVGIKAVDDYTLKITLEKATPYFLSKLSYTVFQPVRMDIIEGAGSTYGKDVSQLIYSGPFKIESYESNNKMVLVKNDNYWDKDNIKLNKINMTNIQEFATQAQLFESKQLDVTGATNEYIEKWKKAADEGKWQAGIGDTPQMSYLAFNQKTQGPSGLMGNAKVRKAIGYSIDREELTGSVYGRYTPAYGSVPKTIMVGDDVYRDVATEPIKSEADKLKGNSAELQKLLHEGLKELGKDTDDLSSITIEYLTSGTSELDKQRQEWMKQQIEKNLGINVKINVSGDIKLYYAAKDKGEYDIYMGGWNADYNDPMTFLDMWATDSDNNDSGYSNKEYDALLTSLDGVLDNKKRLETYEKLEKLLLDDCGMSPLFYQDTRRFTQNYVKGFQTPAFGSTYEFRWTYIEGKN